MKWYFLSSTIFWNRAKFILGSIHLLSTSRKISLWLYSGCWLACSRNPILEQFQHNSSFTCGFSYIITYGPHPVFLNYFFILWIVFLDWLTWNNRSTATSDWQHSVANFFQTFFPLVQSCVSQKRKPICLSAVQLLHLLCHILTYSQCSTNVSRLELPAVFQLTNAVI